MRLDHVSYATSRGHLADTVQRIGSALGATFSDGGLHPRFGTRNFVLPLAGGTYLEVVAALDHPAADQAPFGQAVKARADAGGGWLGWALAVDDITPVEERLGRPSVEGHRRRPDGVDLTWRQIGVNALLDDPALPFFIQWTVGPELHPSVDAKAVATIVGCEVAGDPDKIHSWIGGDFETPIEGSDVHWVEADDPGLVAVHFQTNNGVVRID